MLSHGQPGRGQQSGALCCSLLNVLNIILISSLPWVPDSLHVVDGSHGLNLVCFAGRVSILDHILGKQVEMDISDIASGLSIH